MSREIEIKLLMDHWKEKHINKGYKRFIRDGIVCEEKWEAQHTPRVCYFLKEAYTSNENGYNLVKDLHDCEHPWTMWRKVAIWTQAIHNAFDGNICEYDDEVLRSKETDKDKESIQKEIEELKEKGKSPDDKLHEMYQKKFDLKDELASQDDPEQQVQLQAQITQAEFGIR